MIIDARLNNLRISPRKVRVVAKMLCGLSPSVAMTQLDCELRRASLPLKKLIASVVANAEHNFHAVPSNLIISNIIVGEGRKLKRWLPRAQGRATPLWKRMSSVRIILKEEVSGMRTKAGRSKKNEKSSLRVREKSGKTPSLSEKASSLVRKSSGVRPATRSIFQRKSS